MPHVDKWKYEGEEWPSVNGVTGLLHSAALDNWLLDPANRAKGKEAQRKGTAVAKALEKWRLTSKYNVATFGGKCAEKWQDWYNASGCEILETECHLVNTLDKYHGSPDVILSDSRGEAILGDDKAKKRFADYKLLMNEHAYAMCDSIERPDGSIVSVPWKTPIKRLVFWNYDPDTAEMFVNEHEFSASVYKDFLALRGVYEISKKSELYFKENAVLIPSQRRQAMVVSIAVEPHPRGIVSDV